MNNLINGLTRIMDLPYGDTFINEVSRKLHNTIMIVNNSLFFVTDFFYEDDIVIGYDFTSFKKGSTTSWPVQTIEVFTPESGLYSTNEGLYLYITKVPKKQWYKSFHSSAYKTYLNRNKLFILYTDIVNILDIKSINKKDIILTKAGQVFYHDIFVGLLEKENVKCCNVLFKQEIIDWIKDGNKQKDTNKVLSKVQTSI